MSGGVKRTSRQASLSDGYAANGRFVLEWRAHGREQVRWAKAGLTAARRLSDRESEGRHLSNLGHAYMALGQARRALTCHRLALSISRAAGNRQTEAEDLFV